MPGRENPSLKLSSPWLLRKPGSILANTGFHLNFSIFIPC